MKSSDLSVKVWQTLYKAYANMLAPSGVVLKAFAESAYQEQLIDRADMNSERLVILIG
jgi:hypothetical protein